MSDERCPAPPVAPRRPHPVTLHGETREDDWYWLREKDDPAVRAYLEAENAYTDAVMGAAGAWPERLYGEMLARIQETDVSVPWRDRGFYYYSRTEEGRQYPTLCRRRGSLDSPEEVTLDLNAMAAGHPFFSIGAFAMADDGNRLAYSTDVTGFREYTLRVRDLAAGADLPLRVERVSSVAWAADSRTLFYVVDDDAKRPHRLFRHTLGTDVHDLLLEETDELFRIGVGRSRSGALIFLAASSHTTSEWRLLPAGEPRAPWRLVAPRVHEREYDCADGDVLYIRVNDRGRNFRLVSAPRSDPGTWTEVVPHRDHVMLEAVEPFARHLVLCEREGGLEQLRVIDRASGEGHLVSFPEPAYEVLPVDNHEHASAVLRFRYQSMVTPASVFDYDMRTRERTLLKRQPVLGGYDPARYAAERLLVRARDGASIPVSVVYRRDLRTGGPQAFHLYGYGSYGIPLPVSFSSNRLSLLDRGVVMAIAHVRGGGELGKPWHDAGRMQHKTTTFTDFVAVAEHLVAAGWTAPDRLVIEGGSAGGLLMGAVVNLRPDLFRAVVAKVPFVDVLNTMSDASLPLTAGEWEEWGNPLDPVQYGWIRPYCPYTNLARGAYPALLVKAGLHDSQVMYWEPAKYVARLRTLKTDDRVLLLKTNMGAGHGGASGRYDYLREVAFDTAFVLAALLDPGAGGPHVPGVSRAPSAPGPEVM